MDIEGHVLGVVGRILNIPTFLLHATRDGSVIALVTHDWLLDLVETRGTSRLLIDGAEASPTLASFCAENRVSLGEIPFLLQHLPSVRIALPNGVMLLRFDVLQWSCESTTKNLIRFSDTNDFALPFVFTDELEYSRHRCRASVYHQWRMLLRRLQSASLSCGRSVAFRADRTEHQSIDQLLQMLCDEVLGCTFINADVGRVSIPSLACPNANLLIPEFVLIGHGFIVSALPYRSHSLAHALALSAQMFGGDSQKLLFVLYQIFAAMVEFHRRAIPFGPVELADIYVDTSLAVQCTLPLDNSLAAIVARWSRAELSNFDYLIALNRAAGRELNNPENHYIFPWVVNFSSRIAGWRELEKSKYRLTKGDDQLELTYASGAGMVPHHITETFSSLTYYIYKARRTPKSILTRHVRRRFVPEEYPTGIQRLYQWTPDEAIPEFYCDSSVFKSIHSDLPDLAVPDYCESIEDFLAYHRAALESDEVSSKLHCWIDLNFGYRLSGEASIRSKNVYLSLARGTSTLTTYGMHQLFDRAHPPRFVESRDLFRPWLVRSPEGEGRLPATAAPMSSVPALLLSANEYGDTVLETPDIGDGSRRVTSAAGEAIDEFNPDHVVDTLDSGFAVLSTHDVETGSGDFPRHISTPISTGNVLSPIRDYERLHKFCLSLNGASPPSMAELMSSNGMASNAVDAEDLLYTLLLDDQRQIGCLTVEMFLHQKAKATATYNSSTMLPALHDDDKSTQEAAGASRCHNARSLFAGHAASITPTSLRVAVARLLGIAAEQNDVKLESDDAPLLTALDQLYSGGGADDAERRIPWPSYMADLRELIGRYRILAGLSNGECYGGATTESDAAGEEEAVDALGLVEDSLADILDQAARCGALHVAAPFVQSLLEDAQGGLRAAVRLFGLLGKFYGANESMSLFAPALERLFKDDMALGAAAIPYYVELHSAEFALTLLVRLGLCNFVQRFAPAMVQVIAQLPPPPPTTVSFHTAADPTSGNSPQTAHAECDDIFVIETEATNSVPTEAAAFTTEPPSLSNGLADVHSASMMMSCVEERVVATAGATILALAKRLGPTLTANCLTVNLLRALSVCYAQSRSLELATVDGHSATSDTDDSCEWLINGSATTTSGADVSADDQRSLTAQRSPLLVGDVAAGRVTALLGCIADLYGEPFVLSQYFQYAAELAKVALKRLTPMTEAGMLASMFLLMKMLPRLSADQLVNHSDLIVNSILYSSAELISSLHHLFPSGPRTRRRLLDKWLDVVYLLCRQLGREQARDLITVPLLVRFFSTFNALYVTAKVTQSEAAPIAPTSVANAHATPFPSSFPMTEEPITRDTAGLFVIYDQDLREAEVGESSDTADGMAAIGSDTGEADAGPSTQGTTMPPAAPAYVATTSDDAKLEQVASQCASVFTHNLAFHGYVLFAQFLGGIHLESHLVNDDLLHRICMFENRATPKMTGSDTPLSKFTAPATTTAPIATMEATSSFGFQSASGKRHDASSSQQEYFSSNRLSGFDGDDDDDTAAHAIVEDDDGSNGAASSAGMAADPISSPSSAPERSGLESGDDQFPLEYSDADESILSSSATAAFDSAIIGNRLDGTNWTRGVSESYDWCAVPSSPRHRPYRGRRSLEGNWLAYWRGELGRREATRAQNSLWSVRQMALQRFVGHRSGVRALLSFETENAFVSGGKDHRVLLFNIRNQGAEAERVESVGSYEGHQRSVLALALLERERLLASATLDQVLIWDPWRPDAGAIEQRSYAAVQALATTAAPSSLLLVGHARADQSWVSCIDVRLADTVSGWSASNSAFKPTVGSSAGLIRSIVCFPDQVRCAIGFSSGLISVLDQRVGLLLATIRAHDTDVVELIVKDNRTLISVGSDGTVAVWAVGVSGGSESWAMSSVSGGTAGSFIDSAGSGGETAPLACSRALIDGALRVRYDRPANQMLCLASQNRVGVVGGFPSATTSTTTGSHYRSDIDLASSVSTSSAGGGLGGAEDGGDYGGTVAGQHSMLSYQWDRLRNADLLRDSVTTLDFLSVNRQLLLGTDSGDTYLIC